jgi:glucose/arabinose dehydrogenase
MTPRIFLLTVLLIGGASVILARFPEPLPGIEEASGPKAAPVPPAVAAVVRLSKVADDFEKPLGLVYAPGDPEARLFVVEQTGRVKILRGEKVDERPFLDLHARVTRSAAHDGSEQGLLGLAFHPRFAENGRLFVNFTDLKGDTRVVELRVAKDDPGRVDPSTEREILFVKQPFANHNGGDLVFGPDGKLYIGLGDGGSGGDPYGNGQNRKALLGKMLRLDVDGPPGPDGRPTPEIRAIGLRNPWRYAFDRKTGDLFIADVGQNKWEEVDIVPAGSQGGENFGWNIMEGFHCFKPPRNCDQTGLTLPVVEYGHDEGCSIIGGFVYRGKAIPEIDGCYFYADYCTALLRSFRLSAGNVRDYWNWRPALDPGQRLATISTFGEDPEGELYIVSLDGPIYKLVRASAAAR